MTTNDNRRLFLIIGIVAVTVILLVVAIILSIKQSGNKPASSGEYVDPNSHQTISNPSGKAPESYGTRPNESIYLGISPLLDHGLSTSQINDLKDAFYAYSKKAGPFRETSLNVDSITDGPHDTSGPTITDSVTFKVVFDRKTTYDAKFVYYDIDYGRLYLYDPKTNTQVFDSGEITAAVSD
jgi:hypothetical protein